MSTFAQTKPRIFVGTVEICGIMRAITHILREYGYDADLYEFQEHAFKYQETDSPTPLFTAWKKADHAYIHAGSEHEKQTSFLRLKDIEGQLFAFIRQHYTVFIFNGWRTIFQDYSDLAKLKQAGKKIITLFLGSEARPAWMSGSALHQSMEQVLHLTRTNWKRVQLFEQYSDYIISHPPASQLLNRKFIPLFNIGLPFMRPNSALLSTWPEHPIIIHAPSSPLKGSNQIHQAIQQVQQEDPTIEYRPLVGYSNADVLQNIAQCSFVVDELYSDALLGVLGLEAAYFGKPVVVGSIPSRTDYMLPDAEQLPPCAIFQEGDLVKTIRQLLNDKKQAQELGQQAKNFLENNWSYQSIGTFFSKMIEDTLPSDEFRNPQDIQYFRGWGMSDSQFHAFVQLYIATFGPEALCISQKPQLLLKLMRWLNQRTHQ